MRKKIYLVILTVAVSSICLTRGVRACDPPPCHYWNGSTWVPYGCVATPCTATCKTCSTTSCACEDDDDKCQGCYDCNNGECESQWSAGDGIIGAAIKKSHYQEWVHYKSSVTLVAKGHDYDDCRGEPNETNFIALEVTEWTGNNLSDDIGASVTWAPSGPSGAGDLIGATIKDNPDAPDGENTDDDDVPVGSVRLIAYEGMGTLIVNDHTGRAEVRDIFESHEHSPDFRLWAYGDLTQGANAETNAEAALFFDESLFEPSEPYAAANWSLRTNPNGADLGPTGHIQVTTGVEISGELYCYVHDDDLDISGLDVSIGVTAGCGPVFVSITYDLSTEGDDCEAQAAVAFGFASDLHGDRSGGSAPQRARSSGDGNGSFDLPFEYNPVDQTFIGNEGSSVAALAKIGGKVEAKGYRIWVPPYDYVPGYWIYYDAEASIGADGLAYYEIGDPKILNPYLADPEPGYYDD